MTRQQQIVFDRYSEMNDRPSGSAIATEYKRGLDGKRSLAATDSLAYAGYLAGKAKRDSEVAA